VKRTRRNPALAGLALASLLVAPACHGPYHHAHHGHHHDVGEAVAEAITLTAITVVWLSFWEGVCECCHHWH